MPFGQEGLVVTWSGPMPKEARVTCGDEKIFNRLAEKLGSDIPKGFPKKYTQGLRKVQLFNASMSWTNEELIQWQKRHGIEMEPEPLEIFDDYLRRGYVIFGTLVEHPQVVDPELYRACSVVLQRAVIVYAKGRETLFLRSYLHSARSDEDFVNFVPSGGIEVSFASEMIWFPLELTRVISEPTSHVVLDILTPEPLDVKQLPSQFHLEKTGRMQYQRTKFNIARVTAQLAAKEKWPDLMLKL